MFYIYYIKHCKLNYYEKIIFFNGLVSIFPTLLYAQFSCAGAVPITNGYTATGITTPGAGTGSPGSWVTMSPDCSGGFSSSITNPTCFDDVFETVGDDYVFSYTTGPVAGESVMFEILAKKSYQGLMAFTGCNGTVLSGCLSGSYSGAINTPATLRVSAANLAANQTIYFAVGIWAAPNDLSFDVTNFTVTPSALSVNDIGARKDDIEVYPNPVKDMLNFSNITKTADVTIYNMQGQKLINKNIQAGKSVDVSKLTPGVYMVELFIGDIKKNYKIIKK